jgi:GAF domain-containing protein
MDSEKLAKLSKLNQLMLKQDSLQNSLQEAGDLIKEILEVDRVSIFVYEETNNLVWTYRADNLGKVVFSANYGVVGYVVKHKTIKVVHDTAKDKNFYNEVDKETGYHTKNLLAVPILDPRDKLIGVIEFINKLHGAFSPKDINIANMFAKYISEPLQYMLLKDGK